MFPAPRRGAIIREGYLFFKKRYPSLTPSQRKFALQACSSKSCGAYRSLLAAHGEAALSAAIRLASAPTTRCCAAVGGSAALRMRHTPCGCRSTYLVEVRSNHLLPEHSSMRRAQQCRYFASSLPPSKRHSRLTTVRRGCCQVATRRDSWRSHVHRTRLRSACSHSSYKLPIPGVEGPSPRLSLGDSKGVFSSEREYPLWCRGAHAALPPALTREKVQPFRAILPSARRAESTCAPAGAKKEHPYGCSFSNR